MTTHKHKKRIIKFLLLISICLNQLIINNNNLIVYAAQRDDWSTAETITLNYIYDSKGAEPDRYNTSYKVYVSCDGKADNYRILPKTDTEPLRIQVKYGTTGLKITIESMDSELYVLGTNFENSPKAENGKVLSKDKTYYLASSINKRKLQLQQSFARQSKNIALNFYLSTQKGKDISLDGTADISGSVDTNPDSNPDSPDIITPSKSHSEGGAFTTLAEVGDRPINKVKSLWSDVLTKVNDFRDIINLITNILLALGVLTSFLLLILNAFKYATASTHPILKREASVNLLICFVCIALLGSIKYVSFLIINIAM